MTYDRRDAREQRRNELAARLADARRRAGHRPGARWSAAVPWALGIVALVLVVPGVWAGGGSRCDALVSRLDELTRRWSDRAPVAYVGPVGSVIGPTELLLGGSDPDGALVLGWIVEAPAHGTLSRGGEPLESPFVLGPVTYEPAPGYSGPEELTMVVRDRFQTSARLVVSFHVYAAPEPSPLPAWPIAAGAPPAPEEPEAPLSPRDVVGRYLLRATPVVDGRERAALAEVNRAVETEARSAPDREPRLEPASLTQEEP